MQISSYANGDLINVIWLSLPRQQVDPTPETYLSLLCWCPSPCKFNIEWGGRWMKVGVKSYSTFVILGQDLVHQPEKNKLALKNAFKIVKYY